MFKILKTLERTSTKTAWLEECDFAIDFLAKIEETKSATGFVSRSVTEVDDLTKKYEQVWRSAEDHNKYWDSQAMTDKIRKYLLDNNISMSVEHIEL